MTAPPPADHAVPPTHADALSTTAVVLVGVGGLAMVVSAFLPWLWSGSGSSISLREAADVALGSGWRGALRWTVLLAYVVPLCGALSIVAAGLRPRAARRVLAVLVGLAGTLIVLAGVLMALRHRAPSVGAVLALIGLVLVTTGWTRAVTRSPQVDHTIVLPDP